MLSIAKRLGCSTAPTSWQFGGMDGLRTELIPFTYRGKPVFCETKQEKAWYNNKVGRKSDVEIDLHGREQLGG